jgi:hypothetical protein
LSATSSAVAQVVSDLTFDVASGGASTATVSAGGTATYHLTIAPSSGSTIPAAVTLTASGGPTGSTITITPQVIPAGAGTTNVVLSIQVPAARAAVRNSNPLVLALAFPFIGMHARPLGMARKRSSKRILFAVPFLILVVLAGAMFGCGSGSRMSSKTQSPTNYSLTVTATSGSVAHSITLTLKVQ